MSFTIEQYTALKEAIATGATTITYGDKTVSYRSLAEMKDLVRMIESTSQVRFSVKGKTIVISE